jgi:hypothetical protein
MGKLNTPARASVIKIEGSNPTTGTGRVNMVKMKSFLEPSWYEISIISSS